MLVAIPPKMSVSRFMGIIKGKNTLMIFDGFANLKDKYGNKTAIQNQWAENQIREQSGRPVYG